VIHYIVFVCIDSYNSFQYYLSNFDVINVYQNLNLKKRLRLLFLIVNRSYIDQMQKPLTSHVT